ncbi:hypothetical protein M3Y99_00784600 [Aphelenchoides fujianensis]|nr:hypothetical protein M3Y99_00784600 [Aphelenchoides fujianensis]
MFNKLRHKILSPKGAAAAYDAPIQKRIQLLAQIRDLAAGIVQECSTLSKTFDYPEGPLHNTAECLSVGLKLLGQALKDKDEDSQKEYERQLDSVKMELLKLTTIKNEHAGLLCNLLALLKAYHASVRQIMESRGVDKWVAATV